MTQPAIYGLVKTEKLCGIVTGELINDWCAKSNNSGSIRINCVVSKFRRKALHTVSVIGPPLQKWQCCSFVRLQNRCKTGEGTFWLEPVWRYGFSRVRIFSHKKWDIFSCILFIIVGHLSAKSAKYFLQRKTAKKIWPHLADLAATANFYFFISDQCSLKLVQFTR